MKMVILILLMYPPGKYSVKAMMIGYETVKIENVIVSVNRTTSLDIKMKQSIVEGQEVVIYASKLSRKKIKQVPLKIFLLKKWKFYR